ncbi:MAG: type II toxin-antitoxin system RelE/ParE family toxin [Alphaproteobacteria bacterium]
MNSFRQTKEFSNWLKKLKDAKGKARILARINSAMHGNFGDCKAVGDGVSEMRIPVGPGYRVYYVQIGTVVYTLLCGGDKSSQQRDISRAKDMAKDLRASELRAKEKGDE